jgi:excisionase family DNA binding protein
MSNDLLTVKQVSEQLNFGPRQIYRWVNSGILIPRRFGRTIRFHISEIENIKRFGLPDTTFDSNGNAKTGSSRASLHNTKGTRRLWEQ